MDVRNPRAEEAESRIPVAHWPVSLVIVQGKMRPQKKKYEEQEQ